MKFLRIGAGAVVAHIALRIVFLHSKKGQTGGNLHCHTDIRLAAAPAMHRLMLLGSPPDMVHNAASHRTKYPHDNRHYPSCLPFLSFRLTSIHEKSEKLNPKLKNFTFVLPAMCYQTLIGPKG